MPYKPTAKTDTRMKRLLDREYNNRRPERHQIYNTSEWRKLREYKRRLNPLCEECLRHGVITPAELVDHIIPIEEGGAMFELGNLQSLCSRCHNEKHAGGRGVKKSRTPC